MTIKFKNWQKDLQESLKGKQHKLDKNKNGKLDAHDFKLLRKEDIEAMTEEQIDEVLSKDASAGDWISDFVKSDDPKFAGKSKEKRKQMALAAYYAKQRNEEVECEDEKKEKKEVEEACGSKSKKSFREFVEDLEEAKKDDYWDFKDLKDKEKNKPTSRKVAGTRYGGSAQPYDDEDEAPKQTEKRGRGRPKGSTSGARTAGAAKKSYGGLTFHSLNLPNSNK